MKFELTKKEAKALERWHVNHPKKCNPGPQTSYPVTFTPTGMGNIVTVSCTRCQKKKDITDIGCW